MCCRDNLFQVVCCDLLQFMYFDVFWDLGSGICFSKFFFISPLRTPITTGIVVSFMPHLDSILISIDSL